MAASLAPTPYPVNARARAHAARPRRPGQNRRDSMADRPPLDLLIKNARLVRAGPRAVETRDLGITDGRFTRVEPIVDPALARAVFDARGQLGFPGVVDAHTHVGI